MNVDVDVIIQEKIGLLHVIVVIDQMKDLMINADVY
jgi:hypothetical protein